MTTIKQESKTYICPVCGNPLFDNLLLFNEGVGDPNNGIPCFMCAETNHKVKLVIPIGVEVE